MRSVALVIGIPTKYQESTCIDGAEGKGSWFPRGLWLVVLMRVGENRRGETPEEIAFNCTVPGRASRGNAYKDATSRPSRAALL